MLKINNIKYHDKMKIKHLEDINITTNNKKYKEFN